MFEAVHGSAPDIADQNLANPTALLLSALLMLDHIGERRAGRADPRRARRGCWPPGAVRTRDLGGTATTTEFTDAICREIERLTTRRQAEPIFDIVLPRAARRHHTGGAGARRTSRATCAAGTGRASSQARERINAYLDELRTTQRYPIYRALKHPLYPILRKVERVDEHVEIAQQATRDRPRHLRLEPQDRTSTTWSSRWCSTTTASGRRSPPPASTCSAGRSGCSTATSPARFRSGATPRTRPTWSR